ncbi:PEP-utilizing enzyme [Dactylosporangium sp. CS-033363]|uniref:PEP-utilizing enzyme n=1 Tax=Dactylosporangium sp. CS-033363 TaxID=3239935 RepID=UPI003D8E0462
MTTEPIVAGVPCSPGRARGPARTLRSPDEFHRFQRGDVLVCRTTDPAWTPLFRLAAAVVTETGGVLSHAAIVAREFGIPAVAGARDATVKLADGVVVTVDGTAGEVLP